ncbi:MAG: lysine--tRNA ligase [Candidatus Aenigmatarchaeota archaeon]|nr:MAG: lysine--tRNA ligase [Candidatus Aenigmarchaeota archaeon]
MIMDVRKSLFWADQIARKIIAEQGDKKNYTCASGITPSGVVHIGNFREIITTHLVVKALQDLGKKVRFIYSWDDFDRFRKIPKNLPDQEGFKKYLMMPLSDVPDPWGCHESYARHFESEIEETMPVLGIRPEYIRQSEMYGKCIYANHIKEALEYRRTIIDILNRYRKKNLLSEEWWPVRIYCENCRKDETKVMDWDGGYILSYTCSCGFKGDTDFSKTGNVKLVWRVDWPMRWYYEGVDFEPAGKDHSTPGGSRDTANEIVKAVWKRKPPTHLMYDFIIIKSGGKMSGSEGNVVKVSEVLDVYIPEIVRFLFAGTKPRKEFTISFDEEVIKIYEDFYYTERVFYGSEKVQEKLKNHLVRVYEMSCVDEPEKNMPAQPGFKHCVELINIFRAPEKALERVKEMEKLNKKDLDRYFAVLSRAKAWLERYAPEKYRFELKEKPEDRIVNTLDDKEKTALKELMKKLEEKDYTPDELFTIFYEICEDVSIEPKRFFRAVYLVLLGKEYGPRLAPFIISTGQKKIAEILKHIQF